MGCIVRDVDRGLALASIRSRLWREEIGVRLVAWLMWYIVALVALVNHS